MYAETLRSRFDTRLPEDSGEWLALPLKFRDLPLNTSGWQGTRTNPSWPRIHGLAALSAGLFVVACVVGWLLTAASKEFIGPLWFVPALGTPLAAAFAAGAVPVRLIGRERPVLAFEAMISPVITSLMLPVIAGVLVFAAYALDSQADRAFGIALAYAAMFLCMMMLCLPFLLIGASYALREQDKRGAP
ncbi:MAG: hypothetical protein IPK87_12795 [Planctomycetes bacterium]|nr:hypothetical protein [Planctomycetota bacterium]